MTPPVPLVVALEDGIRGVIETWRPEDGTTAQALLRLDSGERMWVPTHALRLQPDGSYHLAIGRADIARGKVVFPVVAEELDVQRQVVETSRVQLHKTVREREEVVDQSVVRETVRIDRVPINRVVEGPTPVRQEGATMVIPVFEEVLVVEKRLVLKEEIHVTRQRVQEMREPQRVVLRSEEVTVERSAPTPGDASGGSAPAQ